MNQKLLFFSKEVLAGISYEDGYLLEIYGIVVHIIMVEDTAEGEVGIFDSGWLAYQDCFRMLTKGIHCSVT